MDNSYQLAALRYHALRLGKGRVNDSYWLTLCKAQNNATEQQDRAYIVLDVERALDIIAQSPIFSKLVPTYITRVIDQANQGCWGNNQFEHVVYALATTKKNGYPAIFPRTNLGALIAEIKAQQQRAREANIDEVLNEPKNTRDQLVLAAGAVESMGDRRRFAIDSQGKCWRCGTIKPRRVTCTVCGYTPTKG
jgi:hypothetical protein